MKKKHSAPAATKPSCHQHSSQGSTFFRSSSCGHEVTPIVFHYNAILNDGLFSFSSMVSFLPENVKVVTQYLEVTDFSPPPRSLPS